MFIKRVVIDSIYDAQNKRNSTCVQYVYFSHNCEKTIQSATPPFSTVDII